MVYPERFLENLRTITRNLMCVVFCVCIQKEITVRVWSISQAEVVVE